MILSDHWYKNAIIYSLNVSTFQDSDGDGYGDFQGLTRRLDYLCELGVTCVWLLPFFASPMRDEGYDVSDYYSVDPACGTLGDFVEFMREARDRGIKVLIDLVVNHTSNEHPWFQSACSSPDSAYRDWYVWRDERPHKGEPVLPGESHSTWTYHETARAWYLHHFYDFQPDLNLENPKVRDEIKRIMGFWLELGVSGFRVDAAPYLIEDTSDRTRDADEAHYGFLNELREFLDRRSGSSVLMAEVNLAPDHLPKYYGKSRRFQMLFAFFLNQRIFLAIVRGQASVIADALAALPPLPPACQWATFLRSHDELSFSLLNETEQEEVMSALAADPNARIYDRGIRRRLAPMLHDQRRLLLLYSLLFTLPGSPMIRYGEEIGMGDDLSLKGREAVRTPMQWDDSMNAGFSTSDAHRLKRQVIASGAYAYQHINVDRQQKDPNSLLRHIARMIRFRRLSPELGWGECQVLRAEGPLLVHRVMWEKKSVVAIHNLSNTPIVYKATEHELGDCELSDVFGDQSHLDSNQPLEIVPYGYRWLCSRIPNLASNTPVT